MQHDLYCPDKGEVHEDAAKRALDAFRLIRTVEGYAGIGRWIAVALADGKSDGVLYDSKRDAVRHQHHNEQRYAFICIPPADLSLCEMARFLKVQRMLYDKGIRLTDPDDVHGGRQVIPRLTVEDQRSLLRSIASGGRLRPANLIHPARIGAVNGR